MNQNIKLSVIIPNFRRYESLNTLLSQLIGQSSGILEIIVVDSTPKDEKRAVLSSNIITVLSTEHKNAAYQRFLGYVRSKSEYLLFLDNDMEFDVPDPILDIIDYFGKSNCDAIAIGFKDKCNSNSLSKIPKSILINLNKTFKKRINWLTGYGSLKDGAFGLCGVRGKQPAFGGPTTWLSGGAFASKKTALFQNFNYQIFDLFECGLGMGEDAIIGYTISKKHVLQYFSKNLFLHNDQNNSNFSSDSYQYSKRVIYSRLYLSLEKTRLDCKSNIYCIAHFNWFAFWRICGYLLNWISRPDKQNKQLLLGAYKGWYDSLFFNFEYSSAKTNFWAGEAQKDILLNERNGN